MRKGGGVVEIGRVSLATLSGCTQLKLAANGDDLSCYRNYLAVNEKVFPLKAPWPRHKRLPARSPPEPPARCLKYFPFLDCGVEARVKGALCRLVEYE